jgi:hypothetical protein
MVPPPRGATPPGGSAGGARARAPREASGARAAAAPGPAAEQERDRDLRLDYSTISGSSSLDPLFNTRFHLQMLRHAAMFVGLWLFAETLAAIVVGFLALVGVGVTGVIGLWSVGGALISIVLAAGFWLLPVPALLAQWSLLVNDRAAAVETAFAHITEALRAHQTPFDTIAVRPLRPPGEGHRDYLELRQGRFAGYVSCFAHGRDLYVGWTFWLYLSPLRLLLMIIGRKIQEMSGRGNDIHQTLRYESTRATIAATHSTVLEGIDVATGELDPAGGRRQGIRS